MNRIEQLADYRVSLHKNIYNEETINTIMDNIIEEFTLEANMILFGQTGMEAGEQMLLKLF